MNPSFDKPMVPSSTAPTTNPLETDMTDITVEPSEEELDSEGMTFDFGDTPEDAQMDEFDGNLAEIMSETVLGKLSADLIQAYDADKNSRRDWEKGLMKGLELVGMKFEERTEPWAGASGVFHPVLAETAIQFQAHAIMELFPASGPARTTIFGDENEQLQQVAKRVEQEINFQITQKMTEYRTETEQLLYRLALSGSGFKKVYPDPTLGRAVAMFVPAEDFVASYGASDLQSCERYTHVMKRSKGQLTKLMKVGFYKDEELPDPTPIYNDVREKMDKLVGERPTYEVDDKYTLLEMNVDLDLSEYDYVDAKAGEGVSCPYVVTIEYQSQRVLAVRRNWKESDPLKLKRVHFVHYQYLPGLGFYGTGLVHIIGGLAKSATSILRQMIDAGTLSNLPAGFKAKGLRIKSDNSPLMPGEFRDVDVPGQSIRDSILPLPFKEPSAVLFQLLGSVVEEARRVGSVPDMDITDLSEGLPVGTTLAVLERSLKVMSAVQARMHAALRIELGLISDIIAEMPGGYEYGIQDGYDRSADFKDRISIVPVSDPNAATTAQRVIQYQTVLQLASQQPALYDMPRLHRTMLEYIGVKDAAKLVKMPDDFQPMDPVAENMAIIMGQPVKAFLYQDHKSHIAAHMAMATDPSIVALVQQAPNAQAILAAGSAHILEHVAMGYRADVEAAMGVSLPQDGTKLSPDQEKQVSALVAQASQKVLADHKAAQAQQAAQQASQDPLVQIEQARLQLDSRKVDISEKQLAARTMIDIAKGKSQDEIERIRIAADLAKAHATGLQKDAHVAAGLVSEMANTGLTAHNARQESEAQRKHDIQKTGLQHQHELGSQSMKAQQQAVLDGNRADLAPKPDTTSKPKEKE